MIRFGIICILVVALGVLFSIKIANTIRAYQDKQLIKVTPNVYVMPNVLDRFNKIKLLF